MNNLFESNHGKIPTDEEIKRMFMVPEGAESRIKLLNEHLDLALTENQILKQENVRFKALLDRRIAEIDELDRKNNVKYNEVAEIVKNELKKLKERI